jgi:hypothetical protein
MHLHSRKPSAHRASVATSLLPTGARWAPARPIQISSAGASTLAFLVAPVRWVSTNSTLPTMPQWAPARPIQISSAGASTLAFLVAPVCWVSTNSTLPTMPRWAPARPIQISSAGASTPAFLVAPVRWVNTTSPSRPAAVGSWKTHPISTSGGSTRLVVDRPSPSRLQSLGEVLGAAPRRWAARASACRRGAQRGGLVSVRDRGGDQTNTGMPGVVAKQDHR